MMFLPKESAASTSFAAMVFLSVAVFFVLFTLDSVSHSVNAFQLHNRCFGSRQQSYSSSTAMAARQGDGTCSALPQKIKIVKQHSHNNHDIAKVWANSLEHKIPWHASSRQYLSDADLLVVQSYGDDETTETNESLHNVSLP